MSWTDILNIDFITKMAGATAENLKKASENSKRKIIVDTAESFVGQEEIRGNMGFKNAWFQKLMVSVGFRKTHAWCAYFAELVFKEAYKKFEPQRFKELDRLFSASVMRTLKNFTKAGYELKSVPLPGDLIIWQSGRTSKGHIGIVVGVTNDGKYVYTVEGNTNKAGSREGNVVGKKKRLNIIAAKSKGLHIRGYISPI